MIGTTTRYVHFCSNFSLSVSRYVRQQSVVTDFRTQWSGIRKCDLRKGEAISFAEVNRMLTLKSVYNANSLLQVSARCSSTTKKQDSGGSCAKERPHRADAGSSSQSNTRHRVVQALHAGTPIIVTHTQ